MIETEHEVPQDWQIALQQADADLAAGKPGTPWLDVKARLIARIAKAETARAKRQA